MTDHSRSPSELSGTANAAPRSEPTGDILDLLHREHEEVQALLVRLDAEERSDPAVRANLFDELKGLLGVHSWIEEELFYPEVRDLSDRAEQLVQQALADHRALADHLAELTDLDPLADTFSERLEDLHDSIEGHLAEEEGKLFGEARRGFSQDELDSLGVEMETLREDLLLRSSGGSDISIAPHWRR